MDALAALRHAGCTASMLGRSSGMPKQRARLMLRALLNESETLRGSIRGLVDVVSMKPLSMKRKAV